MKNVAVAVLGVLICSQALAQTAGEPVAFLGYAIGQKLQACPADSRATVIDQSRHCSFGPGTFAGAEVVEHSITLFNGEVIGTQLKLAPLAQGSSSRILQDLRQRFGEPDRAYSRPDLDSHVWTRSPVVLHFDGVLGSISASDVIRSEVAKLRAAPSNQFDF